MAEKIGILTFHCAHNYGAVLQTYATQMLLKQEGYEAEVIDYRPDYLVKPYRIFDSSRLFGKSLGSTLRHFVSEALLFPARMKRYRTFERFISSKFELSERVTSAVDMEKYGSVLIGSDQVWNRRITGGQFDPMYFGGDPSKTRFIADAVSMESDFLSAEDAEYIKGKLSNFAALSVRESQLASLLNEKCGADVGHIQDPVIQVDPKVWDDLAAPSVKARPYILVYRLRDHESINPFVRRLASDMSADIIEVNPFPDGRKLFRSRQSESVEDFLGLIKGASCVVTTSYHAVLFSTIFSRPFYCFRFGAGQDTRQSSFLSSVGLEDRMFPLGADVPQKKECDFTQASERLEQMRRQSAGFILDSLSGCYE